MADRIEVSLSRQDRELLKRIASALEALGGDKSDGATAAIKRLVEGAEGKPLAFDPTIYNGTADPKFTAWLHGEINREIKHRMAELKSANDAIKRFVEGAPYWGDEPEAKPRKLVFVKKPGEPPRHLRPERGSPETD